MSTLHIAVVSTRRSASLARATVRRAVPAVPSAQVHVLDVDGTYAPSGSERVLAPVDVGLAQDELHLRAMLHEPAELVRGLYPALVRAILAETPQPSTATALVVQPGVLLLRWPTAVLDSATRHGICLIARTPSALPVDDRWPGLDDVAREGAYAPQLLALRGRQGQLLDLWERAAAEVGGVGDRWLEVAASRLSHQTLRDVAALVSPWNLTSAHRIDATPGVEVDGLVLDGHDVDAIDLTTWDPARPWLLDAEPAGDPRGRLSDHPVLAALVEQIAEDLLAEARNGTDRRPGTWDVGTTSLGTPIDAPLRELYRAADAAGQLPPDPFRPDTAADLEAWLTDPAPDGGPGRYLRALHRTRPDLQRSFPNVPGENTEGFLRWVQVYGRTEDYPTDLLDLALSRVDSTSGAVTGRAERATRGRPAHGVNVIGYLRGELGIGESARLMVGALQAAGIPHSTVSMDKNLLSRQRAGDAGGVAQEVYDTSLVCVNADLTPAVAGTVTEVLSRSYRIGMWYWEVQDFPTRHDGFAHVDEVWTATDFVRRAIEPHSPVPVRTVTPPLPQRGPATTLTRADLGLPGRPVFLFSFDFLSTAERKNPIGLIDAFTRAFAAGEGPVLVIKSINACRRPSEAERLRLRALNEPDVLLMEDYLDAAKRDALMALCDCYVSLHRSEGLGLTMAEAMACGKPVIATGYSGNLQFMTEQNSFLVPWTPTTIPAGAEPYPPGGVWADPDLRAAAAMMRAVIDDPDTARSKGARAAADIASLHSPEVAGRQIVARLAESADRRRARLRTSLGARLRNTARRLR